MSAVSPIGILAIGISLLLLLVGARQRFNTPPTNRSGTTFALFHFGMVIFYFLLLAVWVCVWVPLAATMSLSLRAGAFFGHTELKATFEPLLEISLPLVAAALVTLKSYSNRKFLRELDEAGRQFCIGLAAIPSFADQLGDELANQANFHLVSEQLKAKVAEKISNIDPRALNFNDDGSLSSRFTRAVSLYWLFIEPHNSGRSFEFPANTGSKSGYAKTMQLGKKTVFQVRSHYETLMETGTAYFTSARPTRKMEESLKEVVREISDLTCNLIARFVLLQEKTPALRRSRLSSMGFDGYDPVTILSVTQWAIVLFAIAAITLALVNITPRSVPLDVKEVTARVIAFVIAMGVSITAATFVAQRFVDRATTHWPRSIFELTIACLIVAAISAALRIGVSLVSAALFTTGEDVGHILANFLKTGPAFLMLPVANTLSLAILCSLLPLLNRSRLVLALLGALCNGIFFAVTAGIVLSAPNTDVGVKTLDAMQNSGLIGAAVGVMVMGLGMFRRTRREVDEPPPPETYATRSGYADITLGGYSRAAVEELEGRYVCFRPMFAKPDIINAYLLKVWWDVKLSCLTFEEEERADSAYLQKGKIFIPDGKPFMNLVSVETGSVRLITVSRPDARQPFARGLIMTLSVPTGVHFLPAAAPIVLRRLGEEVPKLGFIHPGERDYDLYQAQLLEVTPTFGVLGQVADTRAQGKRAKRPTNAAEKST